MSIFQRKNGTYLPVGLNVKNGGGFKSPSEFVKNSGVFKPLIGRYRPMSKHYATFKVNANSGSLVLRTPNGAFDLELWDGNTLIKNEENRGNQYTFTIPSSSNSNRELRVYNTQTATSVTASKSLMFDINANITEILSVDCGLSPSASYPIAQSSVLLKAENYLPPNCTSIANAFNGCSVFNCDLDEWDTSKVTSMEKAFYNCSAFAGSLEGWDVGNVTTMYYMFLNCINFNSTVNSWNPHNCTNFHGTFYQCRKFNQPVNHWNVSKATATFQMFEGCSIFNQPLNNWDTSNVTGMAYMFNNATNFNQDISTWNVNKVTAWGNFRTGSALTTENTPPKFR